MDSSNHTNSSDSIPHTTIHIRDGFPEQRQITLNKQNQSESLLAWAHALHITHIGHFPKTNYHFVERTHGVPQHILILVMAGRGWIQMDDKLWDVDAGSMVFIPANTPHIYGADESIPWNIYWMHITGPQADAFMRWKCEYISEPFITLSSTTRMIELFETAIRYCIAEQNEIAIVQENSLTQQILAESITVRTDKPQYSRQVEGRIIRSIRYMQGALNQNLTLEELAHSANLSVAHYCSLFREHTGTTPLRFFTRLRLQKACELLENPAYNVRMVAEEMGYDDAFYFGRVFKKCWEFPPWITART